MNILNNKYIGGTILTALILLYIYSYREPNYRKIKDEEVLSWKNSLQPAYFKGKVHSIRKTDNNPRIYQSIYMTLLDSGKLVIPNECAFLRFKKNYLVLDAMHINIDVAHRIERGDIIEKHTGSDTLYIFNKNGYQKYYFFLFDGIAGPIRMPD